MKLSFGHLIAGMLIALMLGAFVLLVMNGLKIYSEFNKYYNQPIRLRGTVGGTIEREVMTSTGMMRDYYNGTCNKVPDREKVLSGDYDGWAVKEKAPAIKSCDTCKLDKPLS